MTVLVAAGLHGGIWQGTLSGTATAPRIEAVLDGAPLAPVQVSPLAGQDGAWALRLVLPPHVLSDGIRTILLRDQDSGTVLGHCTIAAGEAAADLRAEVDLLRAELDLLKAVVRRQLSGQDG